MFAFNLPAIEERLGESERVAPRLQAGIDEVQQPVAGGTRSSGSRQSWAAALP